MSSHHSRVSKRRPKRNARKWGFLQIEDNSFTPESASMSYISSYLHCVFSTKDRLPLITPEIRPRLWSYMGGIARRNGMRAIEIGGVADHMHLILSMPATLPISKAMQLIKGGSSHWVHDTFPEARLFARQKEYGAFSVGAPEMDTLVRYIRSQEEHHRKVSFKEEFIAFLDDNGVPYDERFLWR